MSNDCTVVRFEPTPISRGMRVTKAIVLSLRALMWSALLVWGVVDELRCVLGTTDPQVCRRGRDAILAGIPLFLVFNVYPAWMWTRFLTSVTLTREGLSGPNKYGRERSMRWTDVLEVREFEVTWLGVQHEAFMHLVGTRSLSKKTQHVLLTSTRLSRFEELRRQVAAYTPHARRDGRLDFFERTFMQGRRRSDI